MATAMLWAFSLSGASGNVSFTRFEVPEEFEVGHEVKEAVHQYISETGTPTTVVHSQGAFPVATKWNGILYGANAVTRMQQLDALAVAETPVTFTYGPLSYLVHIKSFVAKIRYQREVHYTIELTVISDQNGSLAAIDNGQSFDAGTQTFYSNATTAVAAIKDPNLPASVIAANQAVMSAFQKATPLKSASLSTIQSLVAFLDKVINEIQPYATALENTAVLVQDLANLNASLIALQGFGLLQRNLLQLLGSGLASTTSVLLGPNSSLFAVAAQYYPNSEPGDVVGIIAQANNLSDFFVTESTSIILPPVFS